MPSKTKAKPAVREAAFEGPWELRGVVWEWKERKMLRVEHGGRECYFAVADFRKAAILQKAAKRKIEAARRLTRRHA